MATNKKIKYAGQGDSERTRVGGNERRKEWERNRAGIVEGRNGSFLKMSSTVLKNIPLWELSYCIC